MITCEQIRGARAMLRWDQKQLAEASGVSIPTIKRMEAGTGLPRSTYENVTAIQTVFETAGIEFIDRNGGGVGVRLRE